MPQRRGRPAIRACGGDARDHSPLSCSLDATGGRFGGRRPIRAGAHCTIDKHGKERGGFRSQVSSSRQFRRLAYPVLIAAIISACGSSTPPAPPRPAWEVENPIRPPAPPPLGLEDYFDGVKAPSPERVRLGRWLFYDTRLSADKTIACASCHRPEYAFSEPTPVSTGIKGQKGGRKAPTFINKAVTLAPVFFWDGR